MRTILLALALLLLVTYSPAPSQALPSAQIYVMGHGTVTLAPDEATITIAMETRAVTAAAAGTQNAARTRAIREALRRFGIASDSVTTSGYSVEPHIEYQGGGERMNGYVAMNTMRVHVREQLHGGERGGGEPLCPGSHHRGEPAGHHHPVTAAPRLVSSRVGG